MLVHGITPRLFPQFPFASVPLDAGGETVALGKTRAFAITFATLAVNAVGSLNVWRDSHELLISVRYPLGTLANIAARGDYAQIRDELLPGGSTTAGVAIRYALNEPAFEAFEDYQVMTVAVRVITDTTRS